MTDAAARHISREGLAPTLGPSASPASSDIPARWPKREVGVTGVVYVIKSEDVLA
jgi:hypothetical protein